MLTKAAAINLALSQEHAQRVADAVIEAIDETIKPKRYELTSKLYREDLQPLAAELLALVALLDQVAPKLPPKPTLSAEEVAS
jgi:hypothetical protein